MSIYVNLFYIQTRPAQYLLTGIDKIYLRKIYIIDVKILKTKLILHTVSQLKNEVS